MLHNTGHTQHKGRLGVLKYLPFEKDVNISTKIFSHHSHGSFRLPVKTKRAMLPDYSALTLAEASILKQKSSI